MDGKAQRRTTTRYVISRKTELMLNPFSIASTPRLIFGVGKVTAVAGIAREFGSRIVLVTGERSFEVSGYSNSITTSLEEQGCVYMQIRVGKEPTPSMVDDAVSACIDFMPDVVVAIGGGSVLDAGKAISAMLPLRENVKLYLEGVGTKVHPGAKVPFIAIPTTSGTGSEATKNAVLSEIGPQGFKRSLRHDNFVPNVAILDPALTVSCPAETTAASGMDAFTQLLESYTSTNANAITDALAVEGLRRVSGSLLKSFIEPDNITARSDMAMAAYLSGLTLANAGLGTIHGFASSIGSRFDIPHGVVCSAMMYPVNQLTIRRIKAHRPGDGVLEKFRNASRIFTGRDDVEALLDRIAFMKTEMKIPALRNFGVLRADLDDLAAATENKNNPVQLTTDELKEALLMAL
jgi:alcohol dehydrogenase class IV